MDIETAIKLNRIKVIPKSQKVDDLIKKELEAAEQTITKAQNEEDTSWKIDKAFYAAFYAARAYMYRERLIENEDHGAVIIFLEDKVKNGELSIDALSYYKSLSSARKADRYQHSFTEERARISVEQAEKLVSEVKKILAQENGKHRHGEVILSFIPFLI
jgi:uncharacterized protein (UPF0332 family)